MLESSLSTPEYFKTSFSAVKVYSELIASDTVSINVRFYVRNMAFSVTTAKTMYFPHSLLQQILPQYGSLICKYNWNPK